MPTVEFNCTGCGAELRFAPGTTTLACAHCGASNSLPELPDTAHELDFESALRTLDVSAQTVERLSITCSSCGATAEFPDNTTAATCCHCGTPIVATGASTRHIKPNAILPFAITTDQARAIFDRWVRSRWFAPSDLRRLAILEGRLAGVYLPFWTFDCHATTRYTGQRGEYYYVTVPYTTTVNGRTVVRHRTERRTRWYPASGTVTDRFNDILISAGSSLNPAKLAKLEPWDLRATVAYADQYLSGFRAESYRIGLAQGFSHAREATVPAIHRTIRADIGGDTQRIIRAESDYANITFKLLLLPVWLCAYRYRQRIFQIMVNARTGELVGDRPWSAWKIAALVTALLAAAAAIASAAFLVR